MLPSTLAGRRDWAPPEQAAVIFVRPLCSLFQPEGRSALARLLCIDETVSRRNATARQLSSDVAQGISTPPIVQLADVKRQACCCEELTKNKNLDKK